MTIPRDEIAKQLTPDIRQALQFCIQVLGTHAMEWTEAGAETQEIEGILKFVMRDEQSGFKDAFVAQSVALAVGHICGVALMLKCREEDLLVVVQERD